MSKIAPALPVSSRPTDRVTYKLNNRILNEVEYNSLFNPSLREYRIIYSGDSHNLDILLEQLSFFKEKNIMLDIHRLSQIDDTHCLPFRNLGVKTLIYFTDTPGMASTFNTYLINTYDEIFKSVLPHLDSVVGNRLIKERKIQADFIEKFKCIARSEGKTIDDYSKKELMNWIFKYVCNHFKYAHELTGEHGEAISKTHDLGGTALATYERGRGVCSGRSRLIKLYANSKALKVPCYLVEGKLGNLGHCWNEFIDSDGSIIEYDSSFERIYKLERLPISYVIEDHEPEVQKVLIRR